MSLKKLGRYDLTRVLGKGAMGLVYEGRDPNLDRRVAIKTIKVENLSDEAAAEYEVRFRTEARSAARLQHPNIVSVYDSDRDIDIAYLVMEFVEGEDLKHHLDKGSVFTLEQTLVIMGDLLSALSYAHQQNVVHRDIKPANLLVIAGGHIKLADFGVARIQDSGDITRTQGTIVGTLKYMSPEQLEGKPIDARTDLFAAGVVLYQLITGQRPFNGETDFAVIQNIVTHKPAAPTSFNTKLPPALDAVVAKALAKARDARYATAQEFADALQAACKQASDITIAPTAKLPATNSNTWTATMMPGESLIATESGLGTNVSTNTGTSASLVTQEVELVYWKDVKDSSDIEDLQGFLNKFPLGIYADLARRRLKSLGVTAPIDALEATLLLASRSSAAAQADDKTLLLLRPVASEKAVPLTESGNEFRNEPGAEPGAEPGTEPTAAFADMPGPEVEKEAVLLTPAHSPSPSAVPVPVPAPALLAAVVPKKKSGLLWIGAAALLAAMGIGFKYLPGPRQATDSASQTTAPLLPASAAASSALAVPDAATPAAAPSANLTKPSTTVTIASTTATASLPQAAASGVTSLPAPKVVRPQIAASKAAIALPTKAPVPEEKQLVVKERSAAPDAPVSAAAAKAAPVVPGNNPKAACEGRILFSFQNCVREQCARPVFTQHPQCVERRAMEESRKEAERNR